MTIIAQQHQWYSSIDAIVLNEKKMIVNISCHLLCTEPIEIFFSLAGSSKKMDSEASRNVFPVSICSHISIRLRVLFLFAFKAIFLFDTMLFWNANISEVYNNIKFQVNPFPITRTLSKLCAGRHKCCDRGSPNIWPSIACIHQAKNLNNQVLLNDTTLRKDLNKRPKRPSDQDPTRQPWIPRSRPLMTGGGTSWSQ